MNQPPARADHQPDAGPSGPGALVPTPPSVTDFALSTTEIDGLLVLRMKQITDARGTVRELFRASAFAEAGVQLGPWTQINATETRSGAIRGLHGEDTVKLVGVVSGQAFGAYVDARPHSTTYGVVVSVPLTKGVQVLVPAGVCNGFQSTGDTVTQYVYCFTNEWVPGMAGIAIHPLDPALGIAWPLPVHTADPAQLSAKDAAQPLFADLAGAGTLIRRTAPAHECLTRTGQALPNDFGGQPQMRHKKLYVNTGLAAGVAVLAAGSYLTVHSSSSATTNATRTTTVRRGTVTATVSGSGNVTSALNESVSFQDCSGTLTAIYVKAGQKVKVGQKLARVSTTDAQAAVTAARLNYNQAVTSRAAAVTAARSSITEARTTYDADASNADDSVASANDTVDAAETTIDTDDSTVSDDKDTVSSAKAKLDAAKDGTDQQAITSAQSAYDAATAQLAKDRTQRTQDKAQLKKDKAAVTSAEKARSQAKTKDTNAIDSATTNLGSVQGAYSQQSAAVTTAKTALATAEATLAKCTLTAPSSATITALNGTLGDSPGSSSSSSTSSTGTSATTASTSSSSGTSSGAFITMVDMSALQIDTSFSESDIASVKVGQKASVIFSALTSATNAAGATVTGTVASVDATSTVTSNVSTYGVTIALVKPPATLRIGQTGTVTITTATKANALYVSTTAITATGVGKTVTVQDGNSTRVTTVQTGVTGDSTTQITSGLTAGQVVVLPTTTTSGTTTGGFPGAGGGGGFGGTR